LAVRDIRQLTDIKPRSGRRGARLVDYSEQLTPAGAERGVGGNVKSPVSRNGTGQAVRNVAGEVTEPLAAVGETGRVLPVQIARFGHLAGRDLSARALAVRHQRDGRDPRDHGDYQPLSQAERLEMRALRAALMSGYQPAPPADPAGGPSG